MIEIAPDVNKIKDGTDSELCWAAACSNALAYTEWGDIDPYNTYEKILKYNGNEGGRSGEKLKQYIKAVLKQRVPLTPYVKIVPPLSLIHYTDLESKGACAILSLHVKGRDSGHAITAYSIVPNNQNDVRDGFHCDCVDSDDATQEQRLQIRVFNVALTYDPLKKGLTTDYILGIEFAYIRSAVILYPPERHL